MVWTLWMETHNSNCRRSDQIGIRLDSESQKYVVAAQQIWNPTLLESKSRVLTYCSQPWVSRTQEANAMLNVATSYLNTNFFRYVFNIALLNGIWGKNMFAHNVRTLVLIKLCWISTLFFKLPDRREVGWPKPELLRAIRPCRRAYCPALSI